MLKAPDVEGPETKTQTISTLKSPILAQPNMTRELGRVNELHFPHLQ